MGDIFLLRHGITDLNKLECYQGIKDNIGLNEQGTQQAKLLSTYFEQHNIAVEQIFCSRLKRSVDTAYIMLENFYATKREVPEVRISPYLAEINFGDFDGVKKEKVLKKYPSFFENNPYGFYTKFENDFPNGESMASVFSRVQKYFNGISIHPKNNYIIIGHNGVNRMIRAYFTHSTPKDFMNIAQQHTEIVKIDLENRSEKIIYV